MATQRERKAKRRTPSDYRDFVHTGPGTLAGRYMRRFWQPVYRAKDLPAGHAKPIKIMNEEFTLFRGESGKPQVVAFRCAHRGAQLSAGWVEGECIRCMYHGWKYDASGQCVEQPAEEKPFVEKIRIRSLSDPGISRPGICVSRRRRCASASSLSSIRGSGDSRYASIAGVALQLFPAP